eukprot:1473594-Amphidinium_carterae.1
MPLSLRLRPPSKMCKIQQQESAIVEFDNSTVSAHRIPMTSRLRYILNAFHTHKTREDVIMHNPTQFMLL